MSEVQHSQEQFKLTDKENEQVFRERILFDQNSRLWEESKKPTVHYLAGQPGSGKTSIRKLIQENTPKNTLVVLNTDDLREYHKDYTRLQGDPQNYQRASFLVNQDASVWQQKLLSEALKAKTDLLFDTTLGTADLKPFINGIEKFKSLGYNVQLHVLAVPKEISTLGIYLRYEEQILRKGFGRFVSMPSHEQNFNNLEGNISKLLESGTIDGCTVYNKQTRLEKDGHTNRVYPILQTKDVTEAMNTIKNNRSLDLTPLDKTYYRERLGRLEKLVEARKGEKTDMVADLSNLYNYLQKNRSKGFSI